MVSGPKSREDYSVQERMRLSLNESARFFRGVHTVVIICIIAIAFLLANSYVFLDYITQYGTVGNLPNCEAGDSINYWDLEGNCIIFYSSYAIENYDKILAISVTLHKYNLVAISLIGVFLGGLGIWMRTIGRNLPKEIKTIKSH